MIKQDAGIDSHRFRAPALSLFIGLMLIFVLAQAGTWPGIGNRTTTLQSLGLIALIAATWVFIRQRVAGQWHRTPLDRTLPLWALAFIISTAANPSMFAYILIGLWFVCLYILIWYMTFDALANSLLDPERLLDGLFIAGLPVLASALLEYMASQVLRVSGLMQNPNILGAFLILIIPLTTYRILSTNGIKRGGYVLFLGMAFIVLLLSQSRGGILGVCCSFGLVLFWSVPHRRQRVAIIGGGLALGLALLGLRGDSGRMGIYEQAGDVLGSKFLTGQGLFTFRTHEIPRRVLLRRPPDGQNLHAHNIGFQIIDELGIVGFAALLITIVQFARQKTALGIERWCLIAVAGLLAQQMVDFTIMTPSIALCTILILSIASLSSAYHLGSEQRPVRILAIAAILLVVIGFVAGPVPRYFL